MNIYTAGNLVRLSVAIATVSGLSVDPTTVSLKIKTPDGNVTDLSSTVQHDGIGTYHADFIPTLPGYHRYEWVGTGSAPVAISEQFNVAAALF